MIVLLECTCMISSLCILRWQCFLESINDANSKYLGNQQQTHQKIVVIGLKTPSEFFLTPGGLRGLFFPPSAESLSQKNDLYSGHGSASLIVGFTRVRLQDAKSTITAYRTPYGSYGHATSWCSSFSQQYMWECGFMQAIFFFFFFFLK